jgi:probable phosphomutase (TIGR03848 family)
VAKIVLLRHAHSSANSAGILSGQLPGVSLSKDGIKQAQGLVERIGASQFDSIRVSPMQRCEETIKPWVTSQNSRNIGRYELCDGLIEVDYGKWSGHKLSRLSREPLWKIIQSTPSKVQFPDGEKISAMQKRALSVIEEAHIEKKDGVHLFVSHGDVIKAIVAGLIGLKLDEFQSLVIDPASLTILDFDGTKARLVTFNDTTSNISSTLTQKKRAKVLLGGGAGSKGSKK